jgi:hypothetical protein
VGAHEIEQLRLLKMRMQFHFVHRRPDARVAQQQFSLGMVMFDVPMWRVKPEIHQLFHLPPGAHEILVDVGPRVRAARFHGASGRMEVGKRPVDQVHVEVVEPQVGERLPAGRDHVALGMLVVPELGDDPQIFAPQAAAERRGERVSDTRFVAVDRSAIDVAVADFERVNFDGVVAGDLRAPRRRGIETWSGRTERPGSARSRWGMRRGARLNLAVTLLRAGRLREGFEEYEWRWQVAQFAAQRREFSQPLWRGEPLDGRRILIYGEQGAGDTIQFARYAPLVRNAGGKPILEVLPHLERLMSWMEGGYPVCNALTSGVEFDLQCPLMSLPQRFGTELDSIPSPARFTVPAHGGLRSGVGLVWAANPTYSNNAARSIPAEYFAAFTRLTGVQCWGLQVGPAAADTPAGLTNLAEELIDFGETAAVISQLDLVITVDTAVAHLAGSLGKPVWLLLTYAADWRWMIGRDDTPWYPSMKLLRQKRPGDWGEVVERAVRELQGSL